MKLKLILASIVGFAVSGVIEAGELSKRTYSTSFDWESSDCYKPIAPYIYELDEYNKWEAENYVDEVERYIGCVENEAQSDYEIFKKKMAAAIEDGRDEAITDVKFELDNFISGLQ